MEAIKGDCQHIVKKITFDLYKDFEDEEVQFTLNFAEEFFKMRICAIYFAIVEILARSYKKCVFTLEPWRTASNAWTTTSRKCVT